MKNAERANETREGEESARRSADERPGIVHLLKIRANTRHDVKET